MLNKEAVIKKIEYFLLFFGIILFSLGLLGGFYVKGFEYFWGYSGYILVSFLCVCSVIYYSLFHEELNNYNAFFCVIGLFFLAFGVRFWVAMLLNYTPTNDFDNYYILGKAFSAHDFSITQKIVSGYRIPYFGGIAVFYGSLFKLFGTSRLTLTVINCVLSSLVCLSIYWVAYELNERYAFTAGLLYAIYPTSILSSVVNTNQHGSTLFYLTGIALIMRYTKQKKVMTLIVGGIIFSLGQFLHPSIPPHIVAVIIFFFFMGVKFYGSRKEFLKGGVIFFLVVFVTINICVFSMKQTGVIENKDIPFSYFRGLVVGLDPVHKAQWYPGKELLFEGLTEEEADRKAVQLLKEHLKDPLITMDLLKFKFVTMWFTPDNIIYFLIDGCNSSEQGVSIEHLWHIFNSQDIFYTYGMYILMLIYLFSLTDKERRNRDYMAPLLMLLLYGWVTIHFLNELQQRYRYFGITIVTILASGGVEYLKEKYYLKKISEKRRKKQ